MTARKSGREAPPGPAKTVPSYSAASYDEFPYESYPIPQTHPDRLAVVATLFGMQPASIDRCRVLEIGCAAGGNLLPMGLTQPSSSFVGIDLSARQIADGQKVIEALRLENVQLKHLSILDLNQDFGLFDYIICHGVYSWVPAQVQDKILEICSRNLAPQGVAYVSYNTYPGWHMSGMIRDMLRFHTRRFPELQERVNQARALLSFLAEAAAHEPSAYSSLLQEGLDDFRTVNNSYLLHEYLEDVNQPLYFHQFVERIALYGLQYLAEAEVHAMVASRFGPEAAQTVENLSSGFIDLEQFLDFLGNRKFRQTLICHRSVTLQRKVGPEVLSGLFAASALVPAGPDLAVNSTTPMQFRNAAGHTSSTTEPVLKAALLYLAELWPQAVAFPALVEAARARLASPADSSPAAKAHDTNILGKSLLQLYAANLLELRIRELPFVRKLGECPVASPLARFQASRGSGVTNLRHEFVILSNVEREVLYHLDGKRGRVAILERLATLMAQGSLTLHQEGQPVQSLDDIRGALGTGLEQCLVGLANKALISA